MQQSDGLTTLLDEARANVPGALDRLTSRVYPALRQIAAALLRGEREWHTLQATAVVHEMFIRLFLEHPPDWKNSRHFFFTVSREMRHILTEHARRRLALKRAASLEQMDESPEGVAGSDPELLETIAIDEHLTSMAEQDERAARVVELRVFSGLTMEEIAAVLDVSPATVRDDWRFARVWLKDRMSTP